MLFRSVPSMIYKARRNLQGFPNIEYLVGEVYDIAGFVLQGKKFDRIVFHFSFNYMFPRARRFDSDLLEFWKRHLEKQGEMVIAVHNSFVKCQMPEEWREWEDPFRKEIESQIKATGALCQPPVEKWEVSEINEMFSKGGFRQVDSSEVQINRCMEDRYKMWQVPSVNAALFPPDMSFAERDNILKSAYMKCCNQKTAPTIVKYLRYTVI